jgi:hypothetical protein
MIEVASFSRTPSTGALAVTGRVTNHTGHRLERCSVTIAVYGWGGLVEKFTADALAPHAESSPSEYPKASGDPGGLFWTFVAPCPRPVRDNGLTLIIEGVVAAPTSENGDGL